MCFVRFHSIRFTDCVNVKILAMFVSCVCVKERKKRRNGSSRTTNNSQQYGMPIVKMLKHGNCLSGTKHININLHCPEIYNRTAFSKPINRSHSFSCRFLLLFPLNAARFVSIFPLILPICGKLCLLLSLIWIPSIKLSFSRSSSSTMRDWETLESDTSEACFYGFIWNIMLYFTSKTESAMPLIKTEICNKNMEISTNYLVQRVVNKMRVIVNGLL